MVNHLLALSAYCWMKCCSNIHLIVLFIHSLTSWHPMCCQYSTKIIHKDHLHFGTVLLRRNFTGLWEFFVCYSLLWRINSGSKDGIHVSSIATICYNISSPSSPYLFRSLWAMFTRWCFSLSDSI